MIVTVKLSEAGWKRVLSVLELRRLSTPNQVESEVIKKIRDAIADQVGVTVCEH